MLKTLLTSFAAILFSLGVFAQQGSDELRKKQSEIQKEIDELRQTLDATKKNKKAGLGQLAMIQKKLRLREQAIDNINEQISVIQGNINQSRNEVVRLKNELDTLKVQYEKSVVYAYKNRSNYDFLNFIFSASNFNDALKRVQYLKSYRVYREEQAENIKNTQTLLQQKISNLESSRKQKDVVLQKQEEEKLVLVSERKEKDEFVSKLKAREKELSKELSAKQKADAKLKSAIRVAIAKEVEAAKKRALAEEKRKESERIASNKPAASPGSSSAAPKKEASKTASVFDATPEALSLSNDFEKNRGKLPWPVEKGNVKIHFGTYAIQGTRITGNNPGLTIETEQGGVVKSVFEGVVARIFDIEGNWSVLVRHGKYFTVYSNLSSVSVSKDQQIKVGQMLGRASSNEEGNGEIEFLLMQESRNLDPEAWIRRK
jgi:septal ring factor EnvC (AmiA/AmiB activator)